jgi:transcriptional regulator with XRE-family HTH domain
MNRFEQRMRKRLQNPEIAAGFREQAAERELLRRLEEAREHLQISKEELATRMGRHREAVSRLLNATDVNPTLETLVELLMALGITADITLRLATEGEEPIRVAMAV